MTTFIRTLVLAAAGAGFALAAQAGATTLGFDDLSGADADTANTLAGFKPGTRYQAGAGVTISADAAIFGPSVSPPAQKGSSKGYLSNAQAGQGFVLNLDVTRKYDQLEFDLAMPSLAGEFTITDEDGRFIREVLTPPSTVPDWEWVHINLGNPNGVGIFAKIEFAPATGDQGYVAIDNLALGASTTPANVPEPASLALVAAALAGAGAATRRRAKA